MPVTDVVGHRQHRLLPVQRLADDAREEARGSQVGRCPGARRSSAAGCRRRRGSRAACSRTAAARRSPSASRSSSAARHCRRRSPRETARPNTAIDDAKTTRGTVAVRSCEPRRAGSRVPSRFTRYPFSKSASASPGDHGREVEDDVGAAGYEIAGDARLGDVGHDRVDVERRGDGRSGSTTSTSEQVRDRLAGRACRRAPGVPRASDRSFPRRRQRGCARRGQ